MNANIALNQKKSSLRNEFVILGIFLPYIAMTIGMILAFILATLLRLGVTLNGYMGGSLLTATWWVTAAVVVSAVVLCFLSWQFFGQRKGLYMKEHATVTVFLGHVWMLFAVWDDVGDVIFGLVPCYLWLMGNVVIGLSWCLRRWANFSNGEHVAEDKKGINLEEIGLGGSYFAGKGKEENGIRKLRLRLSPGKTIEDAKKARAKIAGLVQLPQTRVHIQELEDGRENEVDVLILNEDPFKEVHKWEGPEFPGESIAEPITYATYEDGTRPELYLAGKDGESSQHFLVMGMSGSGKSKTWQVIYGSVLTRTQVSVVFGDPSKGLQTGGPLAHGLDWFADTHAKCLDMIDGVERAILARNNYLSEKGYSHWEVDCGLNFLIFHLEEAAKFSKINKLVDLVEAARSAGILIVYSLQRATSDRMKTSTRYNIGASMCHGVYSKRDAELGLSEYTREAGAIPHRFKDRFKGRHYMEADNIDTRRFGMSLQTDWLDKDMRLLREAIMEGSAYRTPLDDVTAAAFGDKYFKYRREVELQSTRWQQALYGMEPITLSQLPSDTQELPAVSAAVVETPLPKKKSRAEMAEEKIEHENAVWNILLEMRSEGIEEYELDTLVTKVTFRSKAWVSNLLRAWYDDGRLTKHPKHGWHYTPQG